MSVPASSLAAMFDYIIKTVFEGQYGHYEQMSTGQGGGEKWSRVVLSPPHSRVYKHSCQKATC